jgi:hypothetical protein
MCNRNNVHTLIALSIHDLEGIFFYVAGTVTCVNSGIPQREFDDPFQRHFDGHGEPLSRCGALFQVPLQGGL